MRPDNCMRCGIAISAVAYTMSMFNTDYICMKCKEKELKHPDYEKARQAENEAIRRRDYNFPGIGKPDDL